MNPVFATSAFWQLYLTLEASGVSDDDFAAQLEDLRMDYAVRDESQAAMLDVIKRVSGLPFQFGGEEHSGWLPPGAAVPLPTPIHNVLLDIEIQFDGHGYILCYSARDGSTSGDTWHQSMADAEQTAEELFGIKPSQWQST